MVGVFCLQESMIRIKIYIQGDSIWDPSRDVLSAIPSLSIKINLQQSGQKFYKKLDNCQRVSRLRKEKTTVGRQQKYFWWLSPYFQMVCPYVSFNHVYFLTFNSYTDNVNWKYFLFIGLSGLGKFFNLITFKYELHHLKNRSY